jgi:alanine-synthesizing transaminase
MVIISPNNPTGAVYPREVLAKMVDIAESHDLVVFSDEIYDQMTYDGAEYTPVATLARHTLCGTFLRPVQGVSGLWLPRGLAQLLR